jgi:histidine triad (HIT) family protein
VTDRQDGGDELSQTEIMAEPCIFCQVAARQSPAFIVEEDERTIAFLDRGMATPGHTLVVPKAHSRDIWDVTSVDLQAVIVAAKRVAQLLDDRLDIDGLGLFQSNRPTGWQEVFHFHIHVVPRYAGDSLTRPWKPTQPHETALARVWFALQQNP